MNFKIFSLVSCLLFYTSHLSHVYAMQSSADAQRDAEQERLQQQIPAQTSGQNVFESEAFKEAIAFSAPHLLNEEQRQAFAAVNNESISEQEKSILLEKDLLFLKKNYLEAYITYELTNSPTRTTVFVGRFLSGSSTKKPFTEEKQEYLDYLLARPENISRKKENTDAKKSIEEKLQFNQDTQNKFTTLITCIWDTAVQFSSVDLKDNKHRLHGIQWLHREEDASIKAKDLFLKSLHYPYRKKAFDSKGVLDGDLAHTETWALASIALTNKSFFKNTVIKRQKTSEKEEQQIRVKEVNLNLYSRLQPCKNCRANLESVCTTEKKFFLSKILGDGISYTLDEGSDEESKQDTEIAFAINFYSLYDDNWNPSPQTTRFPLRLEDL